MGRRLGKGTPYEKLLHGHPASASSRYLTAPHLPPFFSPFFIPHAQSSPFPLPLSENENKYVGGWLFRPLVCQCLIDISCAEPESTMRSNAEKVEQVEEMPPSIDTHLSVIHDIQPRKSSNESLEAFDHYDMPLSSNDGERVPPNDGKGVPSNSGDGVPSNGGDGVPFNGSDGVPFKDGDKHHSNGNKGNPSNGVEVHPSGDSNNNPANGDEGLSLDDGQGLSKNNSESESRRRKPVDMQGVNRNLKKKISLLATPFLPSSFHWAATTRSRR